MSSTPKDRSLIQYVNAKLEKYIPKYGEFIATAEADATLYAMRDLEQILGKEIIWVRGKSFDDVIDLGTQTRLPSWATRYCTEQMKLQPIFDWWLYEIGEKVNMRIGFRYDEFDRMERFFNNSDPTNFRIPVACSTRGKRLQRHETFNWRFCSFPLIKHGIVKDDINTFWKGKDITFPVISNCVGCFHKKADTLAIMWNMYPEKMQWFAEQEKKEMGTWLDSRVTYAAIGEHALATPYTEDMLRESGAACDAGGCTD